MPVVPHPAKAVIVGRGLTIAQTAEDVGVNSHTLGRVLNRQVAPWPALRSRLAEHLGLPESELFS